MSIKELILEDENVRNPSAVANTKETESDFAKQTQSFLRLKKQRQIYPLSLSTFGRTQFPIRDRPPPRIAGIADAPE